VKYLQNGGFQRNPYMRLTLGLAAVLLAGFVASSFAMYFSKMGLTPESVSLYINGNEEEFIPARTWGSMIEVTHTHLPMIALVMLLLTHLVIFAPFSKAQKYTFIIVAFLSGLFNEGSNYLVRYVSPDFAILKIASFLTLQSSMIFLLISLGAFLWRSSREDGGTSGKKRRRAKSSGVVSEPVDEYSV
jgi:hypothetical protein